LDFGLG
jgi:hypothetical protein